MPGVRIQHPTERNVRYTVVEGDRPYRTPYQCTPPEFGGCGRVHVFKTHHLNIDETGSCIVGDVLYEKIKLHLWAEGFTTGNVVKKPPVMGIGLGDQRAGTGAWGNIPIVRGKEDRDG
ncbi:MAG: hypothetical protein MUE61_08500 [Vicinamibacterales bacterium]|jgi:hypothetical protein|nr:hypothetical protein [Vicinamibacterales bacterium]MCU0477203.1 hypothetical protein [Chloroflexota bacterium]MCU0562350.1 hypothetical protein [Desulfobacterales bacterium]